MTQQHITNARYSALKVIGGKRVPRSNHLDTTRPKKKPRPDEQVSELPKIVGIDASTVWPDTIGKTHEDAKAHGKIIKNDIQA
ncbi:hypothetical protein GLAREA_12193 [Glarea lozoyensis ATCC 20868]|uniref:Uncharacterized protein n=1 Tax=Glarea lozoyensis (strain ATCC 20868 / MF5171) TaxID=1116229 RepID=S3DJ94_GLAL2|nr:uncharacterized protein GLAREA_12193 [Glarea lozoyensis ATCC 20868]EPE32111.1 hypothetical protein GLAREA_12193 [Glarea lozoyensis ATCC 20868]